MHHATDEFFFSHAHCNFQLFQGSFKLIHRAFCGGGSTILEINLVLK